MQSANQKHLTLLRLEGQSDPQHYIWSRHINTGNVMVSKLGDFSLRTWSPKNFFPVYPGAARAVARQNLNFSKTAQNLWYQFEKYRPNVIFWWKKNQNRSILTKLWLFEVRKKYDLITWTFFCLNFVLWICIVVKLHTKNGTSCLIYFGCYATVNKRGSPHPPSLLKSWKAQSEQG